MITAIEFLTLIFPIYREDSKASRASQRQSKKSKSTAGEKIKEIYYGGNTDEILGQRQKTG